MLGMVLAGASGKGVPAKKGVYYVFHNTYKIDSNFYW